MLDFDGLMEEYLCRLLKPVGALGGEIVGGGMLAALLFYLWVALQI
jgi:hypothetical protein